MRQRFSWIRYLWTSCSIPHYDSTIPSWGYNMFSIVTGQNCIYYHFVSSMLQKEIKAKSKIQSKYSFLSYIDYFMKDSESQTYFSIWCCWNVGKLFVIILVNVYGICTSVQHNYIMISYHDRCSSVQRQLNSHSFFIASTQIDCC